MWWCKAAPPGYSSFAYLAYLAKLPVQVLKIDRSFITSCKTAGCDDTRVHDDLASAFLATEGVAEDMETEEQAKILRLLR
jgi:sensor c-di-GMP phosphodiesterase-like protein